MEKIDFINNQQPALNATNLNKLQDNTEDAIQEVQDVANDLDTNKLDKTSVKDVYSTSATDTYSCNYVNGLETYSTSETRVGTWIDGKPIYRKVFNTGGVNGGETARLGTIDNLDTVISVKGFSYYNTLWTPIPRTHPSNNIYQNNVYIDTNDSNSVKVGCGSSALITKGHVIVDYTKITD